MNRPAALLALALAAAASAGPASASTATTVLISMTGTVDCVLDAAQALECTATLVARPGNAGCAESFTRACTIDPVTYQFGTFSSCVRFAVPTADQFVIHTQTLGDLRYTVTPLLTAQELTLAGTLAGAGRAGALALAAVTASPSCGVGHSALLALGEVLVVEP